MRLPHSLLQCTVDLLQDTRLTHTNELVPLALHTGSEASFTQPSDSYYRDTTVAAQPVSLYPLTTAAHSTPIPRSATSTYAAELANIGSPSKDSSTSRDISSAAAISEPLVRDPSRSGITSILEELTQPVSITTNDPKACTCGCHKESFSNVERASYANASVQTDRLSPPPLISLQIDTYNAFSCEDNDHEVTT